MLYEVTDIGGGIVNAAINEPKRIIHFMGNACNQIPQCRHFFTFYQPDMRVLELMEGVL